MAGLLIVFLKCAVCREVLSVTPVFCSLMRATRPEMYRTWMAGLSFSK